jgi:hypothetical protein
MSQEILQNYSDLNDSGKNNILDNRLHKQRSLRNAQKIQ